MTDIVLPDSASIGDPGHTSDHGLITAAIQAINDGKAELGHTHATPISTGLPLPLFGLALGGFSGAIPEARWNTITTLLGSEGTGTIRVDATWDGIEPTQGTYNFSAMDVFVAAAAARGVRVHLMIGYSPTWANGGASDKLIPDAGHVSNWQAFCYNVALRYIPSGVVTFELWNEPNITAFVGTVNPANYVTRVLQPGYTGIKQAAVELGVEVVVLSAGLAPSATSGGNQSPVDFLTAMYAAGAYGYMDAVGIHPYITPNVDPNYADSGRTNTLTQTWDMWGIMCSNGDSAKQLWATEFGWPTKTGGSGTTTTPTIAAGHLDTWLKRWFGAPWSGPCFYYQDTDTGTDGSVINTYGLADANHVAKEPLFTEFVDQRIAYTASGKPTVEGTWVDAVKSLSPLAWWRFNEKLASSATTADSAGSVTLTKTGTVISAAGVVNDSSDAAYFDGSTGYFTGASTNSLNLNQPHAVAFWHHQTADVGSFPKVFGITGVWNIYYHVANGQFSHSRDGKEVQTEGKAVNYTGFSFLVYVWDGAYGGKWYVNGVPNKVASLASPYAVNTTASTPYMGADASGGNKGQQIIDEVVLFPSYLKDEDVWRLWVGAQRRAGI